MLLVAAIVTFASASSVAGPWADWAVTDAVLRTLPASTSACVSVYETGAHVTEPPGTRGAENAAQATTPPRSGSVIAALVRVTSPELLIVKV